MTLESWLANRWLISHITSAEEISDLLAIVERDLADAAMDRLSADWRLGIAYNAALQLAILALAADGYRPERHRGHERAIRSLRFTVGVDPDLVETLDGVRRKRNLSSYERAGTASSSEAEEVRLMAHELRASVLEWLKANHPHLLADT